MKAGKFQTSWARRIGAFVAIGSMVCSAIAVDSPFERTKKTPTAAPVANVAPTRLDDFQFTGMLTVGGETTFSLYDSKTKQSVWVPLEGSEEGVSVDGFNEQDGTISVSFGGQSRSIVINENEIVTLKRAAPQTVAARNTPAVAANPAKPEKPVRVKSPEIVKKEEEARMFVSDLLANSMVQRERYRKEREEQTAKANSRPSQR